MESNAGRQQLIKILKLVNMRMFITAPEIDWAKLMLPQRLVKLESGNLLPVNHYSMPLGLDYESKSLINLECFDNLAIRPCDLDLDPLYELRSNPESQVNFPFYRHPRYPWTNENDYAIYKWHMNAVWRQN